MGRRVAITGIGLLTALGTGRAETWQALLAGRSAIGPLESFDADSLGTRQGAEIRDLVPERYAEKRLLRSATREDELAIVGASLAIQDSGAVLDQLEPDRFGVFLGGSKETSRTHHLLDGALAVRDENGRATEAELGKSMTSSFYPLFYVEGLQGQSLFSISRAYNAKGPNAYFHGTADAGAVAIARGFRSIQSGESDFVLAGGSDSGVTAWSMSKMDPLGVLTDRNDIGPSAFCPYDTHRSGSLLGEGAAIVVMEPLENAIARNAQIYAEISGAAATFDTSGFFTPDPSGSALASAITDAALEADWDSDAPGYIATHGCATAHGDASEAAALRAVVGARSRPLLASSVKPAIGHLVAAAGAANVCVAALALRTGVLPPTLHLRRPDPACAVADWIPNEARASSPSTALAIARGLEGQNVAIALNSTEVATTRSKE